MTIESIYFSEQAIITIILSGIEAYENRELIFHGEYFYNENKTRRFKSPMTLWEALKFVDSKGVRANLFIERGYRKTKKEPAESIGYILGNRETKRLFGQIAIPYQIARRELYQAEPLVHIPPRKFKESLTVYGIVGHFHTHPFYLQTGKNVP